MPINFPDSPTVDQTFTVGGTTWKWTGTVWDTVTTAVNPVAVSPNYIINGAFDVWQRGTSVTNGQAADRWIVVWNTVPVSSTTSQQAFTPGTAPDSSNEASFFHRTLLTDATGITTFGIQQRIENVITLAGQNAVISFWAKLNSPGNITLRRVRNYGSGGSTTETSDTTIAIGTSWQRYSLQIAIPSVSGKTIGANSWLGFSFLQPVTNGSTMDIWGVQLEEGSVATSFRRHAPSLQGELAACQRYYVRISPAAALRVLGNGWANTTTTARGAIHFPVEMRIDPAALEQSGTAADYQVQRQATTSVTCSAVPTFVTATKYAGQIQFTVASGLTAGEGLQLRTETANAFLGWSAEL